MSLLRQFSKKLLSVDNFRNTPKIHLIVTGFGGQNIVETTEIVRAMDQLPAFHLEQLREISYEPIPDNLLTIYGTGEKQGIYRYGEYIQRNRKIVIYRFDSRSLFFQMLFHEIGHHVFFLILNSKVKKQWVTQLHKASAFITPYAAQSPAEDFAESYAAYILNPLELKQIPEKYNYMRDKVFSGLAGTLKEKDLDLSA